MRGFVKRKGTVSKNTKSMAANKRYDSLSEQLLGGNGAGVPEDARRGTRHDNC